MRSAFVPSQHLDSVAKRSTRVAIARLTRSVGLLSRVLPLRFIALITLFSGILFCLAPNTGTCIAADGDRSDTTSQARIDSFLNDLQLSYDALGSVEYVARVTVFHKGSQSQQQVTTKKVRFKEGEWHHQHFEGDAGPLTEVIATKARYVAVNQLNTRSNPVTVTSTLNGVEANLRSCPLGTGGSSIVVGYVPGDYRHSFLPDLLRMQEAKSIIAEDSESVTMRFDGVGGSFTLTISKAVPVKLLRLEIIKGTGHVLGDSPLPIDDLNGYEFRIRQLAYDNTPSPAIKRCSWEEVARYADHTDLSEFQLEVLSLNRGETPFELQFKPQITIPDGTRVRVDDAEGIAFVWRKGEIVHDLDGETIEVLRRTTMRSPTPWRRVLLAAALVIVIAVAAYLRRGTTRKTNAT